nr:LON peptidase substrate-binding domain-containing protein [Rhodoferax sp. PAMC 29310]
MSEPLTLDLLPLFPLGTTLFPGGLLPLRIFEMRYLSMIGKCHSTGAPFGVVTLTQGAEVRQPDHGSQGGDGFVQEAFHGIGTLATITEFTEPQAGLMVIRCTGQQRFQITHREQLKHGLWTANVTLIAPDMAVPIPPDLQNVATALGNVLDSLNARQGASEPPPVTTPYQLDDCAWVANRWCELLPMPPLIRQQMMALDNPLVRLELVSDVLQRTGIAS